MRLRRKFQVACISQTTFLSRTENEVFLLYSRSNEIRGADLLQPYYYTVPPISVPNVFSPTELDFDSSSKYIYWIDSQVKEVRRTSILGGPVESIIDTGTFA